MRSADTTTIFRVLLVFFSVYLIIFKIDPIIIIIILAIAFLLDGVDGYLAIRDQSSGDVTLKEYILAILGDLKYKNKIKKIKQGISEKYAYGPRMDVAGDRAVEYALWIVFIYLNIIPLFIIFIIIFRHSFVDAIMGVRGTSNKMKTRFAKMMYSSSISRGGVNVVKFITFSYLVFVYVSNWPIIYGYILTTILLCYIVVRGVAEVYESFA